MPRLTIFRHWPIQFIERGGDTIPHIKALNVALIHQLVSPHRRMNGGIGSIELPHLFGGTPDVDVSHGHRRGLGRGACGEISAGERNGTQSLEEGIIGYAPHASRQLASILGQI
jgi:hypothetical protein